MSEANETVVPDVEQTPEDLAAPESSVSRALDGLANLDTTPLADHPDVYQHIHATLQDALAEIDGS